jgi:hypothetical protein
MLEKRNSILPFKEEFQMPAPPSVECCFEWTATLPCRLSLFQSCECFHGYDPSPGHDLS